VKDGNGQALVNRSLNKLDHQDCIKKLFDWLESQGHLTQIDAIGHRIVHGGKKYTQPHLITPDLISDLNEFVLFAPEHLPQELKVIKAVVKLCPNLKQIACFDTAFHHNMPRIAQLYALPRSFYIEGAIRYGFLGLPYEYITEKLKNENYKNSKKVGLSQLIWAMGRAWLPLRTERVLIRRWVFHQPGE
jgi:acetate kinase